jgi:hypothetical protein
LSSGLNYGRKQIQWRRTRVLELSSQGNTQHEIAQRLQVAVGTVNSDLSFLRKQAQENLEHHIHEVIPSEYHKAMTGMKHNLKQTLEIAETVSDPKIKLQARAIVNDCYKYIVDLSSIRLLDKITNISLWVSDFLFSKILIYSRICTFKHTLTY